MSDDDSSAGLDHVPIHSTAANGVTVDIGRPYYDADPTVIQRELAVVEFEGGFGTFDGGRNYVRAHGREAFHVRLRRAPTASASAAP
jgi:hypothetical protein